MRQAVQPSVVLTKNLTNIQPTQPPTRRFSGPVIGGPLGVGGEEHLS
jgi:hypothetical protein